MKKKRCMCLFNRAVTIQVLCKLPKHTSGTLLAQRPAALITKHVYRHAHVHVMPRQTPSPVGVLERFHQMGIDVLFLL
jgi:hypothetical protein